MHPMSMRGWVRFRKEQAFTVAARSRRAARLPKGRRLPEGRLRGLGGLLDF
jgi:hypothetical protein